MRARVVAQMATGFVASYTLGHIIGPIPAVPISVAIGVIAGIETERWQHRHEGQTPPTTPPGP